MSACACACVVLLSGPIGHVIRSFVKIERMGAILTKTGIHRSSFPERRNTKIPSSLLFSPEGNWGLLKLYLRERKELYPLSYYREHDPALSFLSPTGPDWGFGGADTQEMPVELTF